MEESVVDKKVENVLGPLGYDLSRTTESETLSTFFEF